MALLPSINDVVISSKSAPSTTFVAAPPPLTSSSLLFFSPGKTQNLIVTSHFFLLQTILLSFLGLERNILICPNCDNGMRLCPCSIDNANNSSSLSSFFCWIICPTETAAVLP